MQVLPRIGTRASPLALWQAHYVRDLLAEVFGVSPEDFDIHTFRTSGDKQQEGLLRDFGGKGLFTREIDRAQIDGEVDIAVHSAKDLPTTLADGLVIGAIPAREDPRDALISSHGSSLDDLPRGARFGTASLRRAAQVKRQRPDLEIVPLRGNVQTRIAKVRAGEVAATLLALAGLRRLGLEGEIAGLLELEQMLPAPAQGALALVIRTGDGSTMDAVQALNKRIDGAAVKAERALLMALDGNCRTPIAAHAQIDGDQLRLKALVALVDGSVVFDGQSVGHMSEARQLGAALGAQLREDAGEPFFAELARQIEGAG